MGKIWAAIWLALASAFVGYCIYFDKQRRLDPNYKKKVRQRRTDMKQLKTENPPPSRPDRNSAEFQRYEELERYFIQEIELGELLVERGALEEGVLHLANAIEICHNPLQLLRTLKKEMPSHVHRMIIDRLMATKKQVAPNTEMPSTDPSSTQEGLSTE